MKIKWSQLEKLNYFVIAIATIGFGVWMIKTNRVGAGIHPMNLQPTGTGGELFILVGLIFLVVAYAGLSPHRRIKRFFRGERKENT